MQAVAGRRVAGREVEGQLPLVEQVGGEPREPVEPGGPVRTEPCLGPQPGRDDEGGAGDYFLPLSLALAPSEESAAMNASWGTSTRPTIFIRFLPSFCFSSSLRLRVMSPP